MKTRREFIKNTGKGAAAGIIVSAGFPGNLFPKTEVKKVRIGIIGAENSHTIGFGRLFNIEKKFPGCEVLYVWGETDEFAQNAAAKGQIPNIVKDQSEMMGKIDALIVDHRHPKYHLQVALPFVKAGIPTFVDKPFCYRVKEGKEFLKIAEELKTPVTSFSTVAQSDGTMDMKEQFGTIENIQHIVWYGPADVESKYGGIFFYGVHIVQPLMNVIGNDIEKVRVTRFGERTSASVIFSSGYLATLVFTKKSEWGVILVTEKGDINIKSRVQESDPPKCYVDMVEIFRTGKEPRDHQSILKCVAVLEALERSVESQNWETVEM
ncbi:Gfo/Idh/MocA family oxidoreductase [candidate division KSB1 bacterium]|nr:Gfo/Idh/MocA family oxidoreductase [candidate division KSB1 bacterium]